MKAFIIVVAAAIMLVLQNSEGYVIPRPLLRNGFRHIQRAMNERMPVGKRAFDRLDSSPFGFALYNSAGLLDDDLPDAFEEGWQENSPSTPESDVSEGQWQENSPRTSEGMTHQRHPRRFFHASDGYLLG